MTIAEQDLRILKILLTDQTLALNFATNYKAQLLLSPAKELAVIIINYIKKYRNCPTQRILIEEVGTTESLLETIEEIYNNINDVQFNPSEFDYEIKKLKERYVDIKVSSLEEMFKFGEEKSTKANLVEIERTLNDIKEVSNERQIYIQKPIKNHLKTFQENYMAQLKSPESIGGIKTKYSYIDYETNGIDSGELWIVAGESSAGKSLWLSNVAIQLWMQNNNNIYQSFDSFTKGHNILYFSLEMKYENCFRRALARIADIPTHNLRDAKLTKTEANSVSQAAKFISKYPYQFEICDLNAGITIEDIEERYLEANARFPVDVVIVDYMGLMSQIEDKNADDWLKLNYISQSLHTFARKYGTRVISAVQLNRLNLSKKNYEQHELIGLHRIAASQIAYHCDIILQIETRAEEHLRSDMPIHFLKNREGSKGVSYLQKKFSHSSIYDIPWVKPDSEDENFGALVGYQQDDISSQIEKIFGI